MTKEKPFSATFKLEKETKNTVRYAEGLLLVSAECSASCAEGRFATRIGFVLEVSVYLQPSGAPSEWVSRIKETNSCLLFLDRFRGM
jgi:hypothetical protein